MDPVSLTASVIAFSTLAVQSCKATYDLIDGLAGAPQAIANSKTLLSETQKTLDTLGQTLITGPETSSTLTSALRMIELDNTLKSTKSLCDEFSMTIAKFTRHSTESKFSKRDRFTVNFHENEINKFNEQLGGCQRTVSLVLVSINLIVSSHTSEDIERLGDSFRAQEQALVDLGTQLRNNQTSLSNQLAAELQKLCQAALSATKEKRTGQRFGNMQVHDRAIAMQGTAGVVQGGVEQSFGNLTATQDGRAFQGQMGGNEFAMMFGR